MKKYTFSFSTTSSFNYVFTYNLMYTRNVDLHMVTFVLANKVYFQCFCISIRPLQVPVYWDPSLQPFEVKMLIVALRNLHKGGENL